MCTAWLSLNNFLGITDGALRAWRDVLDGLALHTDHLSFRDHRGSLWRCRSLIGRSGVRKLDRQFRRGVMESAGNNEVIISNSLSYDSGHTR